MEGLRKMRNGKDSQGPLKGALVVGVRFALVALKEADS